MTRAQAATVWARLTDAVDKLTEDNHYSSEVGTLSPDTVTLSPETHHWTTDYWSMQSADIRSIADQDAYNCAVQTRIDSALIKSEGWNTGSSGKAGYNQYYNYAVYEGTTALANQLQRNVMFAMGNLSDANGTYTEQQQRGVNYVYFTLAPLYTATNLEKFNSLIAPTLAQINRGMSDKDIVNICIQAVVSRLTYQANGTATWVNGGTTGNCTSYAGMTQKLLSAAGIPSIYVAGATQGEDHAWLQVLVDGQWMIADGTAAEVGRPGLMTMSEHEALFGYPHSTNDGSYYKIARSIAAFDIAN